MARTLAALGIARATYYRQRSELGRSVIRTIGEPLHEDELDTFARAEQPIDEIIDCYNNRRLRSGIGYLTPASVHDGTSDRTWRSFTPSWPPPAIGGEKKT